MELSNKERLEHRPLTITATEVAALSGGFQRRVTVGFFASSGKLLEERRSDSCTYQGDRPSDKGFIAPSGTAWVKTQWSTSGNQSREGSRVYRLI